MSRLIFNHRLLKAIVIAAHLLALVLLGSLAIQIDAAVIAKIASVPAVNSLYHYLNLDWIALWREIGHIIAFVCYLILGSMITSWSGARKHEVLRFFGTAIGVQFFFAASLNVVLFGLIHIGSWWHVLSMIIVGLMSMSMVISTTILVMYRKSLTALGQRQDEAILETKDHL